tara:strand:+ start:509 stop:1090 length:582 start_codon:yes stop_codon:yes gene_type:complete
MKRNFRNVEIQLMTLRIIINLSEHSTGDAQVLETKAHRSCAFLTSEANTIVPIVTESLHAHANEKDIQLEGCKILYILSTNAENVSILSNYGGIGAARTIIAAGESNPVLQRMGLSVLGVLMTSGNQNLTEIIPPKDGNPIKIKTVVCSDPWVCILTLLFVFLWFVCSLYFFFVFPSSFFPFLLRSIEMYGNV